MAHPRQSVSVVMAALGPAGSMLLLIAVFSGVVNVLALTSSIYMLQVYDRVLSSRSVPTLIVLSLVALWLYGVQAILDVIRSRMLVRISGHVERDLAPRVFRVIVEMPLRARISSAEAMQPLRDLDAVRGFLASGGPIAIFDMPWMPIYLLLIFILHPALGWLATCGALLLVGLTIATDRLSREPTRETVAEAGRRAAFAEAARRNAEVLRAMGLTHRMMSVWGRGDQRYIEANRKLSDVSSLLGGIGKALRIALQSAVLGLGAYFVIHGEVTGGIMLAASVTMSRALAPIELAIAQWKGFVAARQGAKRLDRVIAEFDKLEEPMQLPAPRRDLSVVGLYVGPPGASLPTVQNINFRLEAGEALGVIGPSAAGKSTLVRALVGVWRPLRGEIRLDGAALGQWPPTDLGRYIGYLPQDIELFEGTIADNIARFEPNADPNAIVAAAQAAGVHDMVLHLEHGYDTRIGEGGHALSAGQRQRVGLARALYGNPFLVVLDEPNSNLDAEGEAALTAALVSVKSRGGIVIVIAHRAGAISAVDWLCVLNNGQMQHYGRKDEVLRAVMKKPPQSSSVPRPDTSAGRLQTHAGAGA